MKVWEIIITGCGTSHGNPPWGYPALWSDDLRDRRRRSGGILRGPRGQEDARPVSDALPAEVRAPEGLVEVA